MLFFLYKINAILTEYPSQKYRFEFAGEIFIFGKNKRNPIFEAFNADIEK